MIMCHGFGSSYIWSQDYSGFFVKGGYAVFGLDFCGGGIISKTDLFRFGIPNGRKRCISMRN